jgi:acetylglutamate kinase
METLHIIKIGGNRIDDKQKLNRFLKDFATLKGKKILVHGGGKLATDTAEKLGIPTKMVNGRRVTDEATLKIAVMVYAGYINKTIVSQLQAYDCNAVGLSGADGNIIKSKKREIGTLDFGFVGDVDHANIQTELLTDLIDKSYVPVICAITHNGEGQLLNTNADTIVTKLAIALSGKYNVNLTYCFEKKGVMIDMKDDSSMIQKLHHSDYLQHLSNRKISDGMIPKLENAFEASQFGIKNVRICHAEHLLSDKPENIGTQIL